MSIGSGGQRPAGTDPVKPLVIVADDNDDIRDLLSARLGTRGFRVIGAADGREALDAIHEHHPDIAILDWVMPIIQGHELCVKLRTDPRTTNIPIVMLTARGEEEDRLLGLDLGADAYIVKPFDIDELESTLKMLVERSTHKKPPSGPTFT
ncbi:MAG: response regulator [Solirubrobacterales bacterium]